VKNQDYEPNVCHFFQAFPSVLRNFKLKNLVKVSASHEEKENVKTDVCHVVISDQENILLI